MIKPEYYIGKHLVEELSSKGMVKTVYMNNLFLIATKEGIEDIFSKSQKKLPFQFVDSNQKYYFLPPVDVKPQVFQITPRIQIITHLADIKTTLDITPYWEQTQNIDSNDNYERYIKHTQQGLKLQEILKNKYILLRDYVDNLQQYEPHNPLRRQKPKENTNELRRRQRPKQDTTEPPTKRVRR